MDRGAALVLDHLPRHQMATVRGGVEQHVGRPALDAALEHRLQRLVAGLAGIEREIVAEQQAALARCRASRCSRRGRLSMSSRWISTSTSAARRSAVDRGMHRLDQRALAHAARTPEQRVVGRQAVRRSAACCRAGCRATARCRTADERHAGHARHRPQPLAARLPDESVGHGEISPAPAAAPAAPARRRSARRSRLSRAAASRWSVRCWGADAQASRAPLREGGRPDRPRECRRWLARTGDA